MASYDRKPDDSHYAASPKSDPPDLVGNINKQSKFRSNPPDRIPRRRGLEKVRLVENHGRLRLKEDRRATVAKAWVAIFALLGLGAFVAYMAYDPQIDEFGKWFGLSMLGLFFVLPSVLVFLIAVPLSRGIEIDPNEGVSRYWSSYLGLPIKSGRYAMNTCSWTHKPHTITTRGQARQSNAGCLLGLLGPFGTLASGIMMLTDREPDRIDAGINIVMIAEGREQLYFVIFDQPAGREFVWRIRELKTPLDQRD